MSKRPARSRYLRTATAWVAVLLAGAVSCRSPERPAVAPALLEEASRNADLAREGLERSHRFLHGWLAHADAETGLIPRNLNDSKDLWNANDSAADNYPFMVLTAALTDSTVFEHRMRDMLRTEERLTARLGRLPDTYSFSKHGFQDPEPDWERIAFGTSEYVKDGLMPLTEWLGDSPWRDRMVGMLDDLWARAPLETPFGKIPTENIEVNGELLQVLSRVYWMTGDEQYLDWAVRLGDYYLLGSHHPTRDLSRLRLRDHGCEIVSGLCELYATVHFARPDKAAAYRTPLHAMLGRILDVGRNEHGLFYNEINPMTGEHLTDRIRSDVADTWGYTLNGYYTVYQIDSVAVYRDAVLKALAHLNHYRDYDWEHGSADGYADAIESALNLYNREPVPEAAEWIDSEIRNLWAKQQPDGVIEGWHGDGNFARTSIMFSLWKTAGVTAHPWRPDLRLGAVQDGDRLILSLSADTPWQGRLRFDTPRHRTSMHLPLDWPRINQFPEWFTVDSGRSYTVDPLNENGTSRETGEALAEGLPVSVEPGTTRYLLIQ